MVYITVDLERDLNSFWIITGEVKNVFLLNLKSIFLTGEEIYFLDFF